MKVFATPCATGPGARTHQFDALRALYRASSPQLHEWVASPEEADVILLTNAQQQNGSMLECHPLPRRFPEKCFLLSEQWQPPFRLAGIYANAPRSLFWRGRFRSGSYALHHPDFKNPFIESYTSDLALPPEKRDLLFSFAGRNCHPVRDRLFKIRFSRHDVAVEDTSSFDAFKHAPDGKESAQRRYYQLCLRSKFILCPRGCGPNSIRLFEALKLGVAPIIVSDAWIPCEGPRWREFALFVAEKNISDIEEIAAAHASEFIARSAAARRAYEEHFAPAKYFNYLVTAVDSIQRRRVVPEGLFIALWPATDFLSRASHAVHRRWPFPRRLLQ